MAFQMLTRSITMWLCCLSTLFSFAQENRHALLVAVGDYPEESGWHKLSCVNDVILLKKTFLNEGFTTSSIHTLIDEQVTKNTIIRAIEEHLENKVMPGDVAVFYFSGHGQQIKDDNGDEADGLDEAMVPYDSPLRFQKGVYEGERLLRDDELGEALSKVRRRLGPSGNLLVLIDACHSGTATRGRIIAKGTDVIMADKEYLQQLTEGVEEANTLALEMEQMEGIQAPMIAFFSSSPNQKSYLYPIENVDTFSIFTYSFSKAISDLPPNATFRNLFELIKLKISFYTHRQTPQAEGTLDQLIIGSLLTSTQSFITSFFSKGDTLLVNGGDLQGLTPNSRVVIYPPGTTDTTLTEPLAIGSVQEVSPFESKVILDQPIDALVSKGAQVYLTERSFGEITASLQLSCSDPEYEKELEKALANYSFLSLNDGHPELFLEESIGEGGAHYLALSQFDGAIIWDLKTAKREDPDRIERLLYHPLTQYLRANYLRTLDLQKSGLEAEVEILVKGPDDKFNPLGHRPLKIGEIIKLRIKNSGAKGFYYTLIDIQPDHQINTIFPGKETADKYYLKPGEEFTSSGMIKVGKPLGTEVLKIIATNAPLNLNFSRGDNTGPKNPLEQLLSNLVMDTPITRGKTPTLPTEIGFIGSLVVDITE